MLSQFLSLDGVVMHVVECQLPFSTTAARDDKLDDCVLASLGRIHYASSLLRWDLPMCLFGGSGSAAFGWVLGDRASHDSIDNAPHRELSAKLLRGPRGGGFAHDAWTGEAWWAHEDCAAARRNGSFTPSDYARARFPMSSMTLRRAGPEVSCYHRDWNDMAADQARGPCPRAPPAAAGSRTSLCPPARSG
jgi:hypothetical protein